MLILASASDKLQIITGSVGTVDVHVSWMDNVAGSVAAGRTNIVNIATATTTDVVAPPAAGSQRNIKTMHVRNRGANNNDITVVHTDGTTAVQIHKVTLPPASSLQYIDEVGFGVIIGGGLGFGASAAWSTGDAKITLKILADPTWVMMNDGTIGNATSGANFPNITAQALFTLLFSNINDANAPLQTNTGVATTRAAMVDAATAWAANCRMSLTKQLGRALCISGTGAGMTARALGANFGVESATQTIATMAQHQHLPYPGTQYFYNAGNLGLYDGVSGPNSYMVTNSGEYEGGGQPMTNIQPSSFWNVMIKL